MQDAIEAIRDIDFHARAPPVFSKGVRVPRKKILTGKALEEMLKNRRPVYTENLKSLLDSYRGDIEFIGKATNNESFDSGYGDELRPIKVEQIMVIPCHIYKNRKYYKYNLEFFEIQDDSSDEYSDEKEEEYSDDDEESEYEEEEEMSDEEAETETKDHEKHEIVKAESDEDEREEEEDQEEEENALISEYETETESEDSEEDETEREEEGSSLCDDNLDSERKTNIFTAPKRDYPKAAALGKSRSLSTEETDEEETDSSSYESGEEEEEVEDEECLSPIEEEKPKSILKIRTVPFPEENPPPFLKRTLPPSPPIIHSSSSKVEHRISEPPQ